MESPTPYGGAVTGNIESSTSAPNTVVTSPRMDPTTPSTAPRTSGQDHARPQGYLDGNYEARLGKMAGKAEV